MIAATRGFVLSVIAAAIVATATLFTFAIAADGVSLDFSRQDFRIVGSILALGAVIAIGAMLVICVPLTVLLCRQHQERFWTYPLLGFLTGVVSTNLLFTPLPYDPASLSVRAVFELTLVGGGAGIAAGIVWWHGYRKSRVGNA